MTKIPKDKRNGLWARLESEIQKRAKNKDASFKLSGKWKKFVRKESGYKVYAVDGLWVRNNLCCYFGHGGHGFVHEFIPNDEIWVSTHHYSESKLVFCGCHVHKKDQKASKNCFDSVAIHEIAECELMKKGKKFWPSHNVAVQKEKDAGLLPDPYTDL